jgi:hypothetical protein
VLTTPKYLTCHDGQVAVIPESLQLLRKVVQTQFVVISTAMGAAPC